MKVFCAAFMCLQFGFVIFWQKDFGAKATHKMLVKLIPGSATNLHNAQSGQHKGNSAKDALLFDQHFC
jgi:hypothetical protein